MWLVGLPQYRKQNGELSPIMPFRLFKPRFLPKRIVNQLKLNWRPIFSKMEEATSLPNLNGQEMGPNLLDLTFNIATEHLKTNVCSYVWDKYSNYNN